MFLIHDFALGQARALTPLPLSGPCPAPSLRPSSCDPSIYLLLSAHPGPCSFLPRHHLFPLSSGPTCRSGGVFIARERDKNGWKGAGAREDMCLIGGYRYSLLFKSLLYSTSLSCETYIN